MLNCLYLQWRSNTLGLFQANCNNVSGTRSFWITVKLLLVYVKMWILLKQLFENIIYCTGDFLELICLRKQQSFCHRTPYSAYKSNSISYFLAHRLLYSWFTNELKGNGFIFTWKPHWHFIIWPVSYLKNRCLMSR